MAGRSMRKRSPLRLAAAWLGLVVLGTALTVGALLLLSTDDVVQSVASATLQDGSAAASETAPDAAAAAPDPHAFGDMEGEEIEIPVVEQPEDPDAESELENAPAEAAADRKTPVAPRPMPAIEAAAIEKIDDGAREWIVHKLAPLETVDQVAYRYGVRPDALRMWNGIRPETEKLKRGARLKVKARQIPPRRIEIEYVVQEGDTWAGIAMRYGVDSQELRAANWETPRKLVVGETLALWLDPVVFRWIASETPEDVTIPYIRRGAVGIGPPHAGRLVNGVQIPAGDGYSRKMLPSAYGTTHAVTQLVAALKAFHTTAGYEGELLLGSMSARHGGPLTGHVSHQTGRDIDIRLPLRADVPTWFPLEPWRVDWAALWRLLQAFQATGHVQVVFLDYHLQKSLYEAATELGVDEQTRRAMLQWPRGEKAALGLVRHAKGHEQHIHVRFDCGEHEPECVNTDSGVE